MTGKYNLVEVDFNPFEGSEIYKVIVTNESQRELWLSCMIGGDDASLAYNESVSLRFKGKFNLEAFTKAISSLSSRHEALRAVMTPNGEQMIVYADLFPVLQIHDISDIPTAAVQQELQTFIDSEIGKVFDLYNGPLVKFYLHKISQEEHHFTLIIHHLIGDGWSIGVMLEDLSKYYNAYCKSEELTLPTADQISDYAITQADFKTSSEYIDTQKFWLKQYESHVPVINIPLDFSRPANRTYRGKRSDYPLDAELLAELKQLSSKTGSSLVITLVTIFEVLLYHRTGETDMVIGLPAAGQLATGHMNVVGHCVNLLPLKSEINPDQPFLAYLKKRKSEIFDAYDHQRLTFGELIQQLNIKRDKSRIPLVPLVFNVDMGMDEKVNFNELVHHLYSNPRVANTFEISLNVNGAKDALIFEWGYNTQLFNSSTIDEMMREFELVLKAVIRNPDELIRNVLNHSNPFPDIAHHKIDRPPYSTFIDLFREQLALAPGKIAVVHESKHLKYQQLEEKSNQLANYLIRNGVKVEDMVPICIQPSLEMIVGILGILKAGAAYVPIDPELPAQRVEYILSASTVGLIITDFHTSEKFTAITNKEMVLLEDQKSKVWEESEAPCEIIVNPSNLMYVIFTSGSTGNPKGVMIEHGALVDYLFGLNSNLSLIKDCESFALGSSISTDLGNTILYSALVWGGELHLFAKDRFNDPVYIHDYFKTHEIDCLKIVPSHWRFLRKDQQSLFPKKLLIFGGEALSGTFIKEIVESGTNCVVVNHYGPTETTIGKLIHEIDKDRGYPTTVPIGKPFSNTSVYVLNKHLKHCPVGIPGELYIGGDGLARGYLNHPELTKNSFVVNPFEDTKTPILYKTGDLVQWTSDGNIQYLSRLDDQVKIRGYRIELGEIQNILQKHKDVKQSAVVVDQVNDDEPKLVAYVVTETELQRDDLIQYMRNQLPEYMIPRVLIKIDEIPLMPNGKINKKLLPKPDVSIHEHKERVEPSTKEEKFLVEIWSESLGIKNISITDDFFELGGHSLIAVRVMSTIEKQMGIRLPLASLFDHSTIEKLAALLSGTSEPTKKWNSLVPIKPKGSKKPVYLVHGGGLNILVFKSMSNYMDPDQPVYGLQALGLNGEQVMYHTIEEIAAKYITEIIQSDPMGPYLLAGYSLGGKIAFEMARQLTALGKEVKMLGIFDTFVSPPGAENKKFQKKLLRQLRKFAFIYNQVINNPNDAFSYQCLVIKRKFLTLIGQYKEPETEVFTYDDKIVRCYDEAYRKYKMEPTDLSIDLFRVKKRIYYLDDMIYLGWKPYSSNAINVHEIPGDHRTFLHSPNDRELARILQGVIDQKI